MIIKSYEAYKLDLNKYQFVLFYGKNEGLKNEIKNSLLNNKSISHIYEEKEILDHSNNFLEDGTGAKYDPSWKEDYESNMGLDE